MLRYVNRFASGQASVDLGVIDIGVMHGPNGLRLVAYSGANGGIASYEIGSDGALRPIGTATGSTGHGRLGDADMAIGYLGTTTALLVGVAGSAGLTGWGSNLSGAVGRPYTLTLPSGFTGPMVLADQPSPDAPFYILSPTTGRIAAFDASRSGVVELTGAGTSLLGSPTLVLLRMGDQPLVLAVTQGQAGLTVLRHDPASATITPIASLGAADGFAVAALSDLDVVQMGGQTFVIAAAAGTSSLTVLRLTDAGQLVLADHLLDSRDTRFASVVAVDSIVVNGQAYVVAGGGDDGITLFRLLPDGTLQVLATFEDTLATGLTNVSAIEIVAIGDRLFIYVGGEAESGLTVLEWPLGPQGAVITAAAGAQTATGTTGGDVIGTGAAGQTLDAGAGADVLVAAHTATRLTGGAGADVFVLHRDALQTTITDFERGIDRLDLTNWPMLRDVSQLSVTVTSTGITISFGTNSVSIRSADGGALTLADVLPGGIGPSRIPPSTLTADSSGGSPHGAGDGATSPGTPTPPGGSTGGGTGGGGTGGGGTGGGNTGGGGTGGGSTGGGSTGGGSTGGGGTGGGSTGGGGPPAPVAPLEAARPADWATDPAWSNAATRALTLIGTGADDTLTGASGRDFIEARIGNDLIYTGWGADTVYSGPGNDTVYAAGGNNELWGGAGNDILRARSGNDLLGGAAGNDLLDGGNGANSIWGGAGEDTLFGGTGADQLGGGSGNDALYSYAGDDFVFGGPGLDTIHGGAGNDTIWAGAGEDVIAGGAGNDVIASGDGTDQVWGQAGADTFLFYRNYGTTHIRDFSAAEGDQIHLTRWMFGGTPPSPEQIIEEYARLTPDGAVIQIGPANTVIHLHGVTDLTVLEDHILVV